jgi:hypothetical protein
MIIHSTVIYKYSIGAMDLKIHSHFFPVMKHNGGLAGKKAQW